MNILVITSGPVFMRGVHGGSQNSLHTLLASLASLGHGTRVLSVARPECPSSFRLPCGTDVFPILPFKQPFPDPYRVPLCRLAAVPRLLAPHQDWADVVYSHDAGVFGLDEIVSTPLVVGLRDLSYSESLRGVLEFRRDTLIVNSAFARAVVSAALEPVLPGIAQRVQVVHNGAPAIRDLTEATQPRIWEPPAEPLIVLWPHRTEADKGLCFAIRVFYRLLQAIAPNRAELHITEWPDAEAAADDQQALLAAKGLAAALGIRQHVQYLPWRDRDQMKALYQQCHVVLCTSMHPEPFCNVWMESVLAQRPVVAPESPAFRDSLLDPYTHAAPFGDDRGFVASILEAVSVRHSWRDSDERLRARHDPMVAASGLLEAFAAGVREPLRLAVPPAPLRVSLAPWVDLRTDGLFNALECRHLLLSHEHVRELRTTSTHDTSYLSRLVQPEPVWLWAVPVSDALKDGANQHWRSS